ncbi:MAG: type 4a pilus biogenesis protein PilO [Candidatus Pacebacteria bacterium]|nr:type 4a pilus biogenesis protein PilO [Candidatus Paceibacterota bacterium]
MEKEKNKKIKAVSKKQHQFYPWLHLSLAVFFSALFLGGTFWLIGRLSSFGSQAEISRSQLIALKEQETSLKVISQNFSLVAEETEIIENSLPDEAGIVRFVKELKGISRDVSLSVFQFATDQPILDELGRSYIDFSLEAKGGFANLRRFLTDLAGLPYLLKLSLIDFSKTDQEETEMILHARIFVNTPFFQGES